MGGTKTKPHPKGKDNPRGLRDIPFKLPEVPPRNAMPGGWPMRSRSTTPTPTAS